MLLKVFRQMPNQTGNNWELAVEWPGKLTKLKRPPDVAHWFSRARVSLRADGMPAFVAVCSRQAVPVRNCQVSSLSRVWQGLITEASSWSQNTQHRPTIGMYCEPDDG